MLIFLSSHDGIVFYWLKYKSAFLAEVKETIFTAILTEICNLFKKKKKKIHRIFNKKKKFWFSTK